MPATQKCSFSTTLWMNASNSFGDTTSEKKRREQMRNIFRMFVDGNYKLFKSCQEEHILCSHLSSVSIEIEIPRDERIENENIKQKSWNKNRKLSDDYFVFSLLTQFLRMTMAASRLQKPKNKKVFASQCRLIRLLKWVEKRE